MTRTNLIVAFGFALLGLYLIASSFALPPGMGRLPGPGFFPQVIGVAIMLLAGTLLVQTIRARTAPQSDWRIENGKAIAGAIGLVFVYLLLWGTGLFALRTAVFLALFIRFMGQPWKQSIVVSVVLSAVVVAAFQFGLHVSLE
jgi:hypothetical protein